MGKGSGEGALVGVGSCATGDFGADWSGVSGTGGGARSGGSLGTCTSPGFWEGFGFV